MLLFTLGESGSNFQPSVSLRQAAASSRRVPQDTIGHTAATVWTLLRYCQLCSGMGFRNSTRPACRLASASARSARGWSMVLVSDKISRVVAEFSTAGFCRQRYSSAVPKSVPLP